MKLKQIGILALLIGQTMFAIAQSKPAGGYTLTGTVKGIPDGTVEMTSYDSRTRTSTTLNSARLTNGKFVFTGKLATPAQVVLTFTPGNWVTNIFVENGTISMMVDTAGSKHYDYTKYGMSKGATLKKVEVKGSASHSDYQAYEAATSGAGTNRGELFAKQLNYIRTYIDGNPSSVAGALMLSNHYMFNSSLPLLDMENMLLKFTGDAKQSLYYSNLQKEVSERKAVESGNMVQDFTLMRPDSSKFTLSSIKDKYVLIDFWASWCKPCRAAIPHWKEVYAKYKDRGFEIVAVTNDNNWKEWKKALDQEQMPWIQVADEFPLKNMPARVISRYKHGTIPLYVLLDKKGKILAKTGNKEEIDKLLATLLDI